MSSARWDHVELALGREVTEGCSSDALNRPHTVGEQREMFNKWVWRRGQGQELFGSSGASFLFNYEVKLGKGGKLRGRSQWPGQDLRDKAESGSRFLG